MTEARWSLRLEWPQLLVLAAMFAGAGWAWERVPDPMPVHFDIHGQPDRWGSRFEGLLLLPLIAVGLYGLFLLLPRLDPGRANYASFAKTWRIVRTAVLLVMAVVFGFVVASALGHDVPMPEALVLLIGALFVVFGATMGKLRPNWFIGVRTPWTLSSKLSWTRSHRLAGRLFLASGLGSILLLAVGPSVALYFLIGSCALTAVVSVVYSWFVWRGDPERVPPAGTSPAREE